MTNYQRGVPLRLVRLIRMLVRASALTWSIVSATSVQAAIDTVTNLNDSGAGSLRATVLAAAVGDTINFAVTGTIPLTSGPITITQNVSIAGPGPSLITVSGTNASTVFVVTAGVVSISGLTISNGFATNVMPGGGGVNNAGTLTLGNCVVSGNVATIPNFPFGGGVLNTGTLTVANCTVSGNSANAGGGIFNNSATVTVNYSTVSGNSAVSPAPGVEGYGGGIAAPGATATTIFGSTLSGNSASTIGGGIAAFSGLGAAPLVSVTNSTISGNSTGTFGSAIEYEGGTINLNNATIAANSNNGAGTAQLYGKAGLSGPGQAIVESTIIADPLGGGTNCLVVLPGGEITSNGNNLDSANSCGFASAGDLVNTNPLLGPLQNNGGPTSTMALGPGSQAIDAGANPLALAFDQRGPGFPRESGPATDIGAFQVQPSAAATSIPTLTAWMLALLASLLAGAAIGALGSRGHSA